MKHIKDVIQTDMLQWNGDGWVPARSIDGRYWWQRIGDAWCVLTGRADAVTWEGE